MKFDMGEWIGQVTTGHGAMILGPTLLAAASHQMTWLEGAPLLVAGVMGLLWPENTGLKTASQNAVTDVETLVTAYRAGLNHGGAAVTAATVYVPIPAKSIVPTVPVPVAVGPAPDATVVNSGVASAATAAALALMIGAGLALSGCAASTPGGAIETAGLEAAGVSPATANTVVVDANFGATLACAAGPEIVAVLNVKVSNATSAAVANACSAVLAGSSPVPAPVGATLPVVTAPAPVAAAVVASVPAGETNN